MMGLKHDNGRWIQDRGEIDIQCIKEPVVILESPLLIFTVAFFTNNEPHLSFTTFKKNSIEVMKFAKTSMVEIRKKFDELGYDRVFILVADNDLETKKKVDWLSFTPTLIYESPIGTKFIKYETETK